MSSVCPAATAWLVPGTQTVPAEVAVVPPTWNDFSHSTTSRPCTAQTSAEVMPAAPAPTIRTSTSVSMPLLPPVQDERRAMLQDGGPRILRFDLDVLEVSRPVVDADLGRGD